MPVCVPIKDMRDTAKFSELVETTTGPVTVTKNGYSKFVVLRSEDYDLMVQEQAKGSPDGSHSCCRAGACCRHGA